MQPPKLILVPIDLSSYSLSALSYAETLADPFHASVSIVYVLDRGSVHAEAAEIAELEAQARHAITKLLIDHDLVSRSMAIHIRYGHAAQSILRVAEEIHADMIVISTHGKTGVRRALLGGTADRVVRMSPVPVLTIKPPQYRDIVGITEEDVADSLHITGWHQD